MVAIEMIAIFGQHTDALCRDIKRIIHRNVIIPQQLQGMGFFGIIQAVQYDGFISFGNHFSHSMGGIFLHQGQTLGKPNAVTAKKPDDQKAADIGVFQDDFSAIGENRRIGVRTAGHIHRIGDGCCRR